MVITQKHLYHDGDVQLLGYLAYDDGTTAKHPGVIIAPEAPGLGDHVKRRARMFAEAGFVALGVDPYGEGRHFSDPAEMMRQVELTRSNPQGWRQRMAAGVTALSAMPLVDAERLCAVGYCFGGSGVLELARSGAKLRAAVCFHGELATSAPAQPGIDTRLLVLTGSEDPFVPQAQRQQFEDEMRNANASWEMIVYEGAQHAFTNPEADQSAIPGMAFDPEIDHRSWRDMCNWLKPLLA